MFRKTFTLKSITKHLLVIEITIILVSTSGCNSLEGDDPVGNTTLRFEEPVIRQVDINGTVFWTVDFQVREIQPDLDHVEWRDIRIRIWYVNESLAIPFTPLLQFNTTEEYSINSFWFLDNGRIQNHIEVKEIIRIVGIDSNFQESTVGVWWQGIPVCFVRLPSEFE